MEKYPANFGKGMYEFIRKIPPFNQSIEGGGGGDEGEVIEERSGLNRVQL